jgi:hypothetical protein
MTAPSFVSFFCFPHVCLRGVACLSGDGLVRDMFEDFGRMGGTGAVRLGELNAKKRKDTLLTNRHL